MFILNVKLLTVYGKKPTGVKTRGTFRKSEQENRRKKSPAPFRVQCEHFEGFPYLMHVFFHS